MILGLMKLISRLSSLGYQTDSEVPFETYFITAAIWPQKEYDVHKSTPAPFHLLFGIISTASGISRNNRHCRPYRLLS
jgi:hypothetical protein